MKTIYSLSELHPSSRVGLYGAGQPGQLIRRLIELERPDVEIACWINSFSTDPVGGLAAILPAQIAGFFDRETDLVLVTSTYVNEIVATLDALGIEHYALVHMQLPTLGKIRHRRQLPPAGCFQSVIVELTNICNMDCAFCDYAIHERPRGQMDFSLYRRIVDDIADSAMADSVMFLGTGEQMLYKRLDEATCYARDRGLGVRMYTNGLNLTHDRYRRLVESGMSEVIFSFHSITESSFAYRRPHRDVGYQEYYENLLQLIELHLKEGLETKLLLLLSVSDEKWVSSRIWALEKIQREQDDMAGHLERFFRPIFALFGKYGAEIGSDMAEIVAAAADTDMNYGSRVITLAGNITLQFIPIVTLSEWVMGSYRRENRDRFKFEKNCRSGCTAMGLPSISHDGYVVPCCKIPNRQEVLHRFTVGQYGEDGSLPEIVEGERYQRFLRAFEGELDPFCQECLGNYVEEGE